MISLSTNLSNKDIFNQNKQDYEIALKNSGYKEKLIYKSRKDNIKIQNWSNDWKRKSYGSHLHITYMAVATKIGREFF